MLDVPSKEEDSRAKRKQLAKVKVGLLVVRQKERKGWAGSRLRWILNRGKVIISLGKWGRRENKEFPCVSFYLQLLPD
jgi:hypothetical protein